MHLQTIGASLRPAPLIDHLDAFTASYLKTAFSCCPWHCSLDWRVDLHQSAYDRMVEDCAAFQKQVTSLIKVGFRKSTHPGLVPEERAGEDFWYARNGARFPGRYWLLDCAEILSKIAVAFGPARLYVSDLDHLVYQVGAEDA